MTQLGNGSQPMSLTRPGASVGEAPRGKVAFLLTTPEGTLDGRCRLPAWRDSLKADLRPAYLLHSLSYGIMPQFG